jgi:hypothetical protein
MRWNCPHCGELVTAGIDFESTKKAYVRCAKCSGMAVIHRSATIVDQAKAFRLDEEAKADAESRLYDAKKKVEELTATLERKSTELAAALAAKAESAAPVSEPVSSSELPSMVPPSRTKTTENFAIEMSAPSASPPPFTKIPPPTHGATANGYDPIVESAMDEPPSFAFAKPPAFLLKESPQATTTFATVDGPSEAKIVEQEIRLDPRRKAIASFFSSNAAVWLAAGLAMTSGVYLFLESRKALAPIAPEAPSAPKVEKVAEPATAAEAAVIPPRLQSFVVVRVPRTVLRGTPSESSAAVQTVGESTVLHAVDEREGWIRVEGAKVKTVDRHAWVAATHVTRLPN